MLNDNAKKWVAALRSGEYEQGEGWLCKDGRFCCLGVACDLYRKAGHELEALPSDTYEGVVEYGGFLGGLPPDVQGCLGLQDPEGRHSNYNSSLAILNDDGKTFAEIADIIESEPEGLFVQEVTH